jgi:hypothetical protein
VAPAATTTATAAADEEKQCDAEEKKDAEEQQRGDAEEKRLGEDLMEDENMGVVQEKLLENVLDEHAEEGEMLRGIY